MWTAWRLSDWRNSDLELHRWAQSSGEILYFSKYINNKSLIWRDTFSGSGEASSPSLFFSLLKAKDNIFSLLMIFRLSLTLTSKNDHFWILLRNIQTFIDNYLNGLVTQVRSRTIQNGLEQVSPISWTGVVGL